MAQAQASAAPQATITGRIAAVREFKGRDGVLTYFTIVRLPALDEYTTPASVELLSDAPLGVAGAVGSWVVRIGGKGRVYGATNRSTGVETNVYTADNSLTVVA